MTPQTMTTHSQNELRVIVFIPYGFPLWVETSLKNKDGKKEKYNQLLIAQDTGSAIKGKIRGDIFVGKGFDAGEEAKKIYDKGVFYVLIHKNQKIDVL